MSAIIQKTPLSSNNIAELPAGFEGNALIILANTVAEIVRHSKFDSHQAAKNWFEDPANKEQFASIQKLDLSNKNLQVLPSKIGIFTGLVRLNLNGNSLKTLPETFNNLKNLNILFARDNEFKIKPKVCKKNQFKTADFAGNPLQTPHTGNLSKFEKY
ncbi:MAG: hypothetical protein K1000chlam3_00302 [Chlamydiae bacterium]|nr:hypothetical protein [Chlamydiota bacterium]